VADALGSASLRPAARWASQMSQTAAMRVLGTLARAFISAWQRPPVPIRPIWSWSLAPRTLTAGTPKADRPAVAAAVVLRKERRGRAEGFMMRAGERGVGERGRE